MKKLITILLFFAGLSLSTQAQIQINSDFNVAAQRSVDGKQYKVVNNKHVPYADTTDFLATVPKTRRHIGQIAFVYSQSGKINVWQFVGGIESANLHIIQWGLTSIYKKNLTDSVFYTQNEQTYFAFKDSSLSPIAITTNHPYPVQSIADMLALSDAIVGDVAIVADSSKSYILQTTPASTFSNWLELLSPVLASTDYLLEGTTNLYSTIPRIRDAITGGVGIDYSKTTGIVNNLNPYPFNPIQGANIAITGTMPNKTFAVTGIYTKQQQDSINAALTINIQNQIRQDISDSTSLVQNSGSSYTGLISTGGITLVDSTLTIHEDIKWTVNGIDLVKSTPSVFTINTEDSGYYRRDLIYADKTGLLYKIVGIHNQSVGVVPALPDSAVTVTIVDIFGKQIFPPEPVIITKGKNPTLQQVTNRGNTTTDQIISNYNGGGFGYVQNSSKAGYTGIGLYNTSNNAGAASGIIAFNNLNHYLQWYMGSQNNAYISDGAMVNSTGTGGLRLNATVGRISFGRGLQFADTNPPYEYARFDNNGTFNLFNYKNNLSGDSVLTTDATGKVILKKVTFSGSLSGKDSSAYRTATQGSDSLHFDLNRLNGTGTVFKFVFDTTSSGNNGGTGGNYTLPIASATTLGGVKIGSGLSVDGVGVLNVTGGSGGTTYTVSNGLNKVGNDIRLGGIIDTVTNITVTGSAGQNGLNLIGAYDFFGAPVLNITSPYGNYAIRADIAGGNIPAIYATADNNAGNSGIVGGANLGTGVAGLTQTGTGGEFSTASAGGVALRASDYSSGGLIGITNLFELKKTFLNNPAPGYGISQNFVLGRGGKGSGGSATIDTTSKIVSYWTDTTLNSQTANLDFYTKGNNILSRKISISGNGKITFDKYGLGTFAGTAAYNLGVDASGNIIEVATSGGGSLSRFGAEDHLGFENRNFILPDNTFTIQVGDTNVVDRYSRVNITKYGTSIQSTDSSQNYDVSMNVNSDGAQFNLYNSRTQIGRGYYQGVSNGAGVYMESDSVFYRNTRFSIYQLVPAITYTNSAQQTSKLIFPYFNDQTTKYSPLAVNNSFADVNGNIPLSQLKVITLSTNPTTTNIPDGYSAVYKNSTSGLTYLWANIGGTLIKVQLQ